MFTQLILGSPGTGKTTRLLQITEEKLKSIPPERIAFFSFTKKAVNEAKERAAKKFNLPLDRLTNFRTLHSLGYRELRLNPNKVMGFRHFRLLEKLTGFRILGANAQEEELTEKGDQLLFIESYARLTKQSLEEVWNRGLYQDIQWNELKFFSDCYNRFKQEHNIIDWSDMLINYERLKRPLFIDIAFIDEAQDLNPVQWDVVKIATQNAKEVYIAGDDDQAIYRWSGADVQHFLSLKVDKQEVLNQTHRLLPNILDFSLKISNLIKNRYAKAIIPATQNKSDLGELKVYDALEQVDLSSGEWLILVRNNFRIKPIEEYLKSQGYLYQVKDRLSVDIDDYTSIKTYVDKQRGKPVKEADFNAIKKFYRENIPWYEALDSIPFFQREYYRSLLRQNIKLNEKPRICVSTIHGSKGGEAENILLYTDITSQDYDNFMLNPDDEHRVFYVGVTRAKKKLHIMLPQTDIFYPMNF